MKAFDTITFGCHLKVVSDAAGFDTAHSDTAESGDSQSETRRLRPYHGLLVQAFADHGSVVAVARVTGISLPTIHRWKRDPQNMAEVEAARRNVHEALSIFQAALPAAARALCRVATDGANGNADSVTARAADAVFERHDALRRSSVFGQRIARLEKQSKAAGGARR